MIVCCQLARHCRLYVCLSVRLSVTLQRIVAKRHILWQNCL